MLVEVGAPYPADENTLNRLGLCGIGLVFIVATAVARPGFYVPASLNKPFPKPRKLKSSGDIVGMVVMIEQ